MKAACSRKWLSSLLLMALVSACGSAVSPAAPTVTSLPPAAAASPTPGPTATATPVPLPTWTAVPTAEAGMIAVDPDTVLGPISPLVYGTNFGPWASVPGDLYEQALNSGLRLLRFPGGEYGDRNDLLPSHVDQFIKLARQMGVEPLFCVRLSNGTAEQAARWVYYTNIQNDYQVRYWSIGNEPNLYANDTGVEGYDTRQFNQDWRQFAEAMKSVDPTIVLVGPEVNQFQVNRAANPKDAAGLDWMEEFLTANGDLVDIISFHRYPFPTSLNAPAPTIADLRANSAEWDQVLPALRDLIREKTGRDLPVAVTEVNSNWAKAMGGEATTDSFYNAIWWSDSLSRMIRQGVSIVAHFALQSANQTGGFGLLARYEVRPTYYVYQMFKDFGDQQVLSTSGDADVTVVAARRDDGALTVMITNRADAEKSLPLRIAGLDTAAAVQVVRFDAEHLAEPAGELTATQLPETVWPAQSITLLIIQ